jgi:predicted CXXCH cytochrome family protein
MGTHERQRAGLCLLMAAVLLLPAAAQTEVLNPHYSDSLCASCHVDEENPELLSYDQVTLCTGCHNDPFFSSAHHPLRAVPSGIAPPEDWPTLDNSLTCLTCHLPSCEEPEMAVRFLRGGPYEKNNLFCNRYHDPSLYQARDPHAESNRGAGEGCGFCHASRPVPGKDVLATVTFYGNPTVLCRRCHDKVSHPAGFMHTGTVRREEAALFDSNVGLFRGDTIICSTCHNPHVVESGNFKLRGNGVFEASACPGCHTL